MTFQRPEVLLLLPGLVLLLLWARALARRRPRLATTYLLFARAQEGLPPPSHRRRPLLRDLVFLVPAALTTVALAGPEVEGSAGDRVVVVLDRSASMGTLRGERNRVQRGLDHVHGLLGEVEIDAVPPPVAGLAVQASVAQVPAADLAARVAAHAREGRRVVLVTDRVIPGLPEGAGLRGVGGGEPNVGCVAAGFGPARRQLLVRIAGTTAGPVQLVVRDDEQVHVDTEIPGGELPWRNVVDLKTSTSPLRVEVRAPDDANPLDDVVHLGPSSDLLRVGFPPSGHDALYRAFSAHPHVGVFRGEGRCEMRVGGDDGDGGRVLLVAPDVAGFSFGPSREVTGVITTTRGLTTREPVTLPALHPLVDASSGLTVLARIHEEPLLVERGEELVLLQDPDSCNWPSHPSFPLVVASLFSARKAGRSSADRGRITERLFVEGALTCRSPDGDTWTVTPDEKGEATVTLDRPGPTTVTFEDGRSQTLVTAVLDEAATTGPFLPADTWRPPAAGERQPEGVSLVPWLLALAVLSLLAIERPWRR